VLRASDSVMNDMINTVVTIFQQIELLVACKTASVHIHGLAIAIFIGWYIWPLVIRYCVSSAPVAE
jgi:hypothetical protein